jgi:hypothetical protein
VLTNIASVLVGFAMFANLLLTTNDNRGLTCGPGEAPDR